MVGERDKKVLRNSLYAVAGVLAFLLINFLLEERAPQVVRVALGAWVMQLISYLGFEEHRREVFTKFALHTALYILVFAVLYTLIKYLW